MVMKNWKGIGSQRRSGVLVPLFGVYSCQSQGIGDLDDLKLLVDWCNCTGNSILQLLPMNDVGSVFCPYDSTSSFALDPMYLSLRGVKGARYTPGVSGSRVDYAVKSEKLRLLWDAYSSCADDLPGQFREYCRSNSYWLDDFALFCFIKFLQQGKGWFDWDEPLKRRDPATMKKLSAEHRREIDFYRWLQWQLFLQFSAAKEYAVSRGVLLKGDLPILVSMDSADVWAHPQYFNMDLVAGAPPDMYCAKGQRWGTPTYKWEAIFADKGTYLRQKLVYAQNFYDILRVDHVVGLFRIWSIPAAEPQENKGLNGFFDPREEHLWGEHGKRILRFMLENTSMLLCAEDLGVIPPVCTSTLAELAIPGNDVQRWNKDWNVRHDFLPPQEYRQLAVAMLSTHDTTNWPAWWENEAGTVDAALFVRKCFEQQIRYADVESRLFDMSRSHHGRLRWKESVDSVDALCAILGKPKEHLAFFIDLYLNSYREKEKLWQQLGLAAPMRESCDRQLVGAVMAGVLASRAVFCVNSLVDWLYVVDAFPGDAYQYRVNTPGTVGPENWSLRMPLSLEAMLEDEICAPIKKLVKDSGRS